MEHVFFKFHEKQSNYVLRNFSRPTRSIIENTCLIVAVIGFSVVAVSHRTFVYRGNGIHSSTLSHLSSIEALSPSLPSTNFYIPEACLRSVMNWRDNVDVNHVIIGEYWKFMDGEVIIKESYAWKPSNDDNHEMPSSSSSSCSNEQLALPRDEDIFMSYSQTKGFLFLPKQVQEMHNISSQYIFVSRNDAKCFGEPTLQKLVFYITGPETVVTNWFLALHDGDGFIYDPKTQKITDLHLYSTIINNLTHSSSAPRHKIFFYKISILLSSLFLFFTTTTLTSFILHETQNRMLKFTVILRAHVRNRIPYSKLVCRHAVESLVFVPIMVGVLVFLMEFVFFGNTNLGFGVLSLVWCGEAFSVICMRTRVSIYFFPRVFFIYFTLFHVYFFSCPFGFTVTSLNATFLMMLHAMAFFLNRYEFPALQRGIISSEIPRMVSFGVDESIQVMQSLAPNNDVAMVQHPNNGNTITSPRQRTNELRSMLPPLGNTSGSSGLPSNRERDTILRTINTSLPSFSNLSNVSLGSHPNRMHGAGGSVRSSSPSGISSYPSATMFYADGEGEDDDSYGIFMNGEIVRHTSYTVRNAEQQLEENQIAVGGPRVIENNTRAFRAPRRISSYHDVRGSTSLGSSTIPRPVSVTSSSAAIGGRLLGQTRASSNSMSSLAVGDSLRCDDINMASSPSLSGELIWNFNRSRTRDNRDHRERQE